MRQMQNMKSKALGIENFKNFTWALDFPHVIENGNFVGFDVVIGNPPYGVKINEDLKKYYQVSYVSSKTIPNVQKGSLDTFVLFTERGFNILKKNGNLMFILPLSFISSDAVTGLHNLLEKNCCEIKVCSFAVRPQPIFENAVVDVSILFVNYSIL
ncbi:MAG: Eco57I restriction-modification methylase domain-containing protein [Candidatus Woesearchaeota archaeon]